MITVTDSSSFGYGFVDKQFLSNAEDEYSRRFEQNGPNSLYRNLKDFEICILEDQSNFCADWSKVIVQDPFDPHVISRSNFYGLVRLGAFRSEVLGFHDFMQAEGILSSTIISSDIGSHCSIAHCPFIANYIIKDHCILSRIDEMQTTSHAKFGNGVIKEGEDPDVRVLIDVMNEAGGRSIAPFAGITTADAYLWASYRENPELSERFQQLTNEVCDSRRGYYGVIEHDCVIKGTRIIKDVYAGPCSYIKGANKLKNLSLLSRQDSPVQIGEGVELVNGIIGCGSSVFYGSKAVRFVLGDNCGLKYGARLIHSVLGDNSTVSCCEVLNNLVFPGHEQHHNNSFLIASLVMGQSNMAAGATVGSNHNSRGNDGELVAGRGFWPALSSTLKHNSRFASYTLLSKGNYPDELFIELPFSLVSDNPSCHRREVMPAFWWLYNMYALERNSYKYRVRDKRRHPRQVIETSYLAPDTANEIRKGRFLLAIWVAKSYLKKEKVGVNDELRLLAQTPAYHPWGHADPDIQEKLLVLLGIGEDLLENHPDEVSNLQVFGESIENSANPVLILKPLDGYRAYTSMLFYYAMTEIGHYCHEKCCCFKDIENKTMRNPLVDYGQSCSGFYSHSQKTGQIFWENTGGQLIPTVLVRELLDDVLSSKLDSWEAVHQRYADLDDMYPEYKVIDACLVLFSLFKTDQLTEEQFEHARQMALRARDFIDDQVFLTKDKDYRNFFRSITYRSEAEQEAVIGKITDNSFIASSHEKSEEARAYICSAEFSD